MSTMAGSTELTPAATVAPRVEVTINTKPSEPCEDKEAKPKLERKNSAVSDVSSASEEDTYHVARPVRRGPRRYSPSPVRLFNRNPPVTPLINSSTQLLDQVHYDGVVDMPFPARSSIYLTTFPFTEKDVKKWSWLFAQGVEDVFLTERRVAGRANRDIYNDDDNVDDYDEDEWFEDRCVNDRRVRTYNRRSRGFVNEMGNIDIGSVYLSRALDTKVVPEDAEEVTYLIVVQNRDKTAGRAKLLTAESRKAAGVVTYYEALTGNSIAFVGAVVGGLKKKAKRFSKVDGIDEAVAAKDKGVIGVIC